MDKDLLKMETDALNDATKDAMIEFLICKGHTAAADKAEEVFSVVAEYFELILTSPDAELELKKKMYESLTKRVGYEAARQAKAYLNRRLHDVRHKLRRDRHEEARTNEKIKAGIVKTVEYAISEIKSTDFINMKDGARIVLTNASVLFPKGSKKVLNTKGTYKGSFYDVSRNTFMIKIEHGASQYVKDFKVVSFVNNNTEISEFFYGVLQYIKEYKKYAKILAEVKVLSEKLEKQGAILESPELSMYNFNKRESGLSELKDDFSKLFCTIVDEYTDIMKKVIRS